MQSAYAALLLPSLMLTLHTAPSRPKLLLGDNAAKAALDKESGYRMGTVRMEGRVLLWPAQLTRDDKEKVRRVMQSSSWAREDGKH